jgi:hypothetical protein
MLYYDRDPQRQLARERGKQLAHEMRRARRLTPEQAGYPGWGSLAAELLGCARSLRRRKRSSDPVYDV